MAFSTGRNSITMDELNKFKDSLDEISVICDYFKIDKIPCFISSPLRKDEKPSFGFYSKGGNRIYWTDLATGERGGIYDLFSKLWNCSYKEVLLRLYEDKKYNRMSDISITKSSTNIKHHKDSSDLQCKVREWRDYDLQYWESYGISLKWLKYANIYPVSHKIVIIDGKKFVLGADKHAYAFVEFKDNKPTIKIYQPFNKKGYKWANKHDRSVISLWTKLPSHGDKVVVCSSVKDALCLWANTGLPAIAPQGEGYGISDTAVLELKKRFANVFICFDNDEAGLEDGKKLASHTGFKNVVLPQFKEGKDISDYYKAKGRKAFIENIPPLFSVSEDDDLPF